MLPGCARHTARSLPAFAACASRACRSAVCTPRPRNAALAAAAALGNIGASYFIGYLGHANGFADGNQTPNAPNLTTDGAALIRKYRGPFNSPWAIPGDFEAVCRFDDETAWERFKATLARRGRARMTLTTHLVHLAQRVASFEGDFVALR